MRPPQLPPSFVALSSFEKAKVMVGARRFFDKTPQAAYVRWILFASLGVVPLAVFVAASFYFGLGYYSSLLCFLGCFLAGFLATRNVELHYLVPHIQKYLVELERDPELWPNRATTPEELAHHFRAEWRSAGGQYSILIAALTFGGGSALVAYTTMPWYVLLGGCVAISLVADKLFSLYWNRATRKG